MQTRFLLFISFLYCCCNSYAQNLVPNCSFEDTIGCPDGLGYIDYAKGWYSAEREIVSSPDFFFNCGEFTMVPQNAIDFQYAATGKAYAGIIPWVKDYFDTIYDIREFIGIKLKSPLLIGQSYYVSFKVNLGVGSQSAFASDKTGLLFSKMPYGISNPPPINNFAHLYTNQIISDTLHWTTISGWVQADSAYEFICIGNFFEDSYINVSRDYPNMGSWDSISYYFIDDVCVSIDSAKCSCESPSSIMPLANTAIKIYPNPASNFFIVSVEAPIQDFSLCISDSYGNLIKNIENLHGGKNEIPTTDVANGIYFLKLKSTNNQFLKTIVINH